MENDTVNNDLYDYYYVVYQGSGISGAVVLPQSKNPAYLENPDGFNIADATSFLSDQFGSVVIIQNWIQVTEIRKNQFETMSQAYVKNIKTFKPKIRHLSIVKKEEE